MRKHLQTPLLASVLAIASHGATLSAPGAIASAGDSLLLSVSLASGGQNLSALQFDLAWDAGLDLHIATGAQTGIANKTLYANYLQPRVLRCLVTGLNNTVLSDGELVRLFVNVQPGIALGVSQLRFLSLNATDPSGVPLLLTGGLISVQVQAGTATQAILPAGFLNAASFASGPVSPGEIITIFGQLSDPTPSVLFNGVRAPLLYAGPGQVNAIVPFGLDLSNPAQIQIQQSGSTSAVTAPVAAASPSIFTQSQSGTGQGAILNQDYGVNSPQSPATRGSVIMVYGTGFGALNPLPADGKLQQVLATTPSPVTATIAGVPAQVTYAGAAPGLIAGAVQVNVQVPAGITPNLAAPISLSMGTFTTQPGVTVSIK